MAARRNLFSFRFLSILVLTLCGALAGETASDETSATSPSSRDVSSPNRPTAFAVERSAPAIDREAPRILFEQFQKTQSSLWRISWSRTSGFPEMMEGRTSRSYGATAEEAAIAFVNENRMLLGLIDQRHSIRFVRLTPMRSYPCITLQQEFNGIDVYEGLIRVVVDEQGHVLHATSSVWPVTEADFSSDVGDRAVRDWIDKRFAGEKIAYNEEPRRVIFPSGTGQPAYLTYLLVGREPWRALIDARKGIVLELTRLVMEEPAPPQEYGVQEAAPPDTNDACDRVWVTRRAGVTPVPNPADPYYVDVSLGTPDLPQEGPQAPGIYAAGIKLLPCIEYTIEVDYSVDTWGNYNQPGYHMDVFFVNVNSTDWYWNLGVRPSAELFCTTNYDENGGILPGKAWVAGGDVCGDNQKCSLTGSFTIQYEEPDNTKDVFLSVGMDRISWGCPSWGAIRVKITAPSRIYNPNPVATMNQMYADQDDANFAVPCAAYQIADLAALTPPAAGQPWRLTGSYCTILQKSFKEATYNSSRDGDFPYLRRCDTFEGVNAYHHITQSQIYIQSLGFFNANNRVQEVDPHAWISQYKPEPVGFGYIEFREPFMDAAEDGDVILHEYGHAIQDNQTMGTYLSNPGGDNGFGCETWAMGEGFADYWGCSEFADESLASGFDPAVYGEWDSEDMTKVRRVNKNKIYPDSMRAEHHADGEIWSRTLWDLFLAVGKETADNIILESHYLQPERPLFTHGAKRILAADAFLYGGAHEDTIVDLYVDRGIFRELSVAANLAGVPIGVSPQDVRGDQDGLTGFGRVYAWGDTVALTASASMGGIPFTHWTVDGVAGASGDLVANVVMDHTPASHEAVATYGTGPVGPVCSVSPTILDFGYLNWGNTADRAFTIANTGDSGSITGIVSEICADYDIVTGEGAFALAAGESLAVTVRFTPTSLGVKNCVIDLGTASCPNVSCSGIAVWSNDPATNTPFCTVDESQFLAGATEDGENGIIIVWDDSRYPGYGIYAQRLDEKGIPLWALDGVAVSPGDGTTGYLALVADGAGGAIMAWPRSGDVIVQRVNGQGVPMWGANGVPICADPGTQGAPLGIATDGANGAIVTWNDSRAPAAVYARRVNGAGVAQWGGSVHLGLGRTYWNDGTISDEAGGIIAMAYPPLGAGVGVQRVSGSGALLWGSSGVLLTPVTASGLGPNSADGSMGICLVPDGFSGAIFTWQSGYPNSDIFAQRLDQNGARMWAPASGVPICTNGSAQTNPNLCRNEFGGAVIAWSDFRTPMLAPDIFAQHIDNAGVVSWGVDGVPVSIQRRASEVRQIVSDGNGGAIISWVEPNDVTSSDIWAQRLDAFGQPAWTAGGEAVCIVYGHQVNPKMVRQDQGGAIIAWEDTRNNPFQTDLYVQQIGCTGDLGTVCPPLNLAIGGRPKPHEEPSRSGRNSDVPSAPALYGGVPNPFNPSTRIRYDVPSPGGEVVIGIYDVTGRLIRTLVRNEEAPGEKSATWDGRSNEGEAVSSGIYFCQMTFGSFSKTRKLALLR